MIALYKVSRDECIVEGMYRLPCLSRIQSVSEAPQNLFIPSEVQYKETALKQKANSGLWLSLESV